MSTTPLFQYPAWLISLVVFFLILLFIWLGTVYRNHEVRKGKEKLMDGWGSLENSMLTLLGSALRITKLALIRKISVSASRRLLDRPRSGLINLDAAENMIEDLRGMVQ
jgi:hypothetical protein